MPTIKDTDILRASALNLLKHVNLKNGPLTPWLRSVIHAVIESPNPNNTVAALLILNRHLNTLPYPKVGSAREERITMTIETLARHRYPGMLVEALIHVQNHTKGIQSELYPVLHQGLRNHHEPLTLAKTILIFSHTRLLKRDNPQALANLEKIILFSQLWFDELMLCDDIKSEQFTQRHFDALIEISEKPNGAATRRYDITPFLEEFQLALVVSTDRRHSPSRFFTPEPTLHDGNKSSQSKPHIPHH